MRYILFVIMGLLAACSSNTAPGLNISIQSASYLNPDINGQAAPVVISIYQLSSAYSFNNAAYASLANNSSQVLGNDLLDKKTFMVRPQTSKAAVLILDQNAKYIGIMAGFRKINQAMWHKVVKLPTDLKNMRLRIHLASEGISTKLVKKKSFTF